MDVQEFEKIFHATIPYSPTWDLCNDDDKMIEDFSAQNYSQYEIENQMRDVSIHGGSGNVRHADLVINYHRLYDRSEAKEIFRLLEREIKYRDEKPIKQWRTIPRSRVAFGDEGTMFSYDGETKLPTIGWSESEVVRRVRADVGRALGRWNNFALVTRYADGEDFLNASPDENDDHPIAMVSFGATRRLHFYHCEDGYSMKINLYPGLMYVVEPPTNQYWFRKMNTDPYLTTPYISIEFENAQSYFA